ncbi:MAG: homoserine kinase [Gammaproteobacteria bacterium]|nr:homoserine kinase [Gammaproteobacteria bacterium]
MRRYVDPTLEDHRVLTIVTLATSISDSPDVASSLERYDIGDVSDVWLAEDGIENTNYFVRTITTDHVVREYVLTIVETQAAAPELLVPLLDACGAAGLPVASPVLNSAGQPTQRVHGKRTLLSPRLGGRHVSNPTLSQCSALGRFIARFHLVSRDLANQAPDYPRTPDWLAEQARLAERHIPYSEFLLIQNAIAQVRSLLGRTDVHALPKGIIHGDLFRDNVLFTERSLTGVLDFHHAARGFWIYDLAVAANDWCNDARGVLDPERTLALLKSYHGIRPLLDAEMWFFPIFSVYAAVAFWMSRLSVALSKDPADTARYKNPAEFRDIVAQLSAHFFYLDTRLLA